MLVQSNQSSFGASKNLSAMMDVVTVKNPSQGSYNRGQVQSNSTIKYTRKTALLDFDGG